MNKQEILTAINKTIKGQGSAVDVGGKLAAILESIVDLIPAEQVNSDWNATEGPAEILNKPTIPEGTLVIPITVANHVATIRQGGPTNQEIIEAILNGRSIIGHGYLGNDLASLYCCSAIVLDAIAPSITFFGVVDGVLSYARLDL